MLCTWMLQPYFETAGGSLLLREIKSPSPSTSIRVSRVGDLPLSGGDALLPG